MNISEILNLTDYPIHRLNSPAASDLLERCRTNLETEGVLTFADFVRPVALEQCVSELLPHVQDESFLHSREHNIYFDDSFTGVAIDHPAQTRMKTTNRTVCADQIQFSILTKIYEWSRLHQFFAAVVGKPHLYPMVDPLARINVKSFLNGERTNWHFDRSEFTITLLLQKPKAGGVFEYRRNLRSDTDPNYDGVGCLLEGNDTQVRMMPIEPGTLTIFRGKNTAHRVSPVQGDRMRIVAVLSYFDSPNVKFTEDEQLKFYGRCYSIQ